MLGLLDFKALLLSKRPYPLVKRHGVIPDELFVNYEGHLESKERFAIQSYLLIIGKKQNMQVFSYTFTYFST